jgi:hypothetical protein
MRIDIGQCGPSSDLVSDMTPDEAADGADDEGDGEDREGGQKCEIAFGLREEDDRNGRRKIPVDAVVEPFDEVADETGGDDAPQRPLLLESRLRGRRRI